MALSSNLILFTGGGTGGHVYPALAVHEEFVRQGHRNFAWIGSYQGVERSIVKNSGIHYYPILSGKLRRYFDWRNFTDVLRIIGAFFQALVLMLKLKPKLVFSKGGFVSVPPVIAAGLLGIPVISHESDFDPGLATRINTRFSSKILVAYPKTLNYFPKYWRGKRVICTGNPVRSEIFSGDPLWVESFLPQSAKKKLLLVLGGSLGAQEVNQLILGSLPSLTASYYVVHQIGPGRQPETAENYYAQPYFKEELPHLIARAEMVITRSGAGSLWELCGMNKKMVLIPLEEGSRGDQILNAKRLEGNSGVKILLGDDKNSETLMGAVMDLSKITEAVYPDYNPKKAVEEITAILSNHL